MDTLTTTQREDFIAALGIANSASLAGAGRAAQIEAGRDLAEPEDVVQTHEALGDFSTTHGRPSETVETAAGPLFVWERVQLATRQPRGTLYLMQFDGVSASLFR
jgi:hypothetical protein